MPLELEELCGLALELEELCGLPLGPDALEELAAPLEDPPETLDEPEELSETDEPSEELSAGCDEISPPPTLPTSEMPGSELSELSETGSFEATL